MTSDRDLTESADAAEESYESDVSNEETPDSLEVEDVAELTELERVSVERDEYLDALRRLQAEFENFRKRVIRQQTELLERATTSLVERLLPVLDALDLALAHGEQKAADTDESAFVQIAALFRDVLAKEGLERIDEAAVPFDPTIHDAVAHVAREQETLDDSAASDELHSASSATPPGHVVVEVLRAGYRLKGRVLRPAMVKVEG